MRAALQKLIASPQFAHSRQLQHFLEFTVERALAGRSDEIKEYTIAVEVLGRNASHDTNVDPIVRTEARRLRRKLEEYYQAEGAGESLRIHYPKGSYAPRFLQRSVVVRSPQQRARRSAAAVLTGVGLILLGVLLWKTLDPTSFPSDARTAETWRIAVLPFVDFSPGAPDPSLTYAITESLTTRLSKIEALSVASRTSVTQVIERNLELQESARLLQADYVLEGSVIRSGDDCRISALLVRARDNEQLWAEEYELPWSDVLEVTSRVAENVARALSVAIGVDASDEAVRAENLRVVESYSRGMYYLLQFQLRRLRPHAAEAERYLKKTLQQDPDHVDAMVALAELSYRRRYPPQGDPEELLDRTERYLEEALARRPNHSSALSLLGTVAAVRGERDKALRLTRRAVQLAPRDARAQSEMGARLGERGFYESALLHYEKALELDPLHAVSHAAKLWLLCRLGRFDEALEAEEAVRRIEPKGPTIELLTGDISFMAGNYAEARRAWDRGTTGADPNANTSYLEIALGLVAGLDGNENESSRVAEKYRESSPRAMDHLIQLFAVVGESDLAAYHIRHSPYYSNYRWLVTTPALRTSHATPAFQNLANELYLQWRRDIVSIGADSSLAPAPMLPAPEELLLLVSTHETE